MTTPIGSTSVTTINTELETQATHAINVPPPPKNEVQQLVDAAPPPQTQTPTSAARESTQPASTGYAASVEHGAEPVKSPELQAAEQLQRDIQYLVSIPNQERWRKDATVSATWVRAVANDGARSQGSRDAAAQVLSNPAFARADANGDGQVSLAEATAYLDKLKGQAVGNSSSHGVSGSSSGSEIGSTSSVSTGSMEQTGSSDSGSGSSSISGSKPPSTKPGIEGALENLGNLGDDLQRQITDTINDPKMDATSKQAKLTQLQSQQQSVMNMLNQISQMLQNVVKMWSDIAMNSVRNIR